MASSSKSINMPLMFAISIGATVSLLASVMFGLAWYAYENRRVIEDQVLTGMTHDKTYNDALDAQQANLGDIEAAMDKVAVDSAKGKPGHEGHGGESAAE